MARVFDLDLELVGVVPRIWRRVRLPAAASLPDLHHVIQTVMRWEDRHLHLFEIDGREYSVPPDEDWEEEAWEGADEATMKLSQAIGDSGGTFDYVYDFGDDWRLRVRVAADHVAPGAPAATCLAGELAAPPEDFGGPHLYQEFLDEWTRGGRRGLSKELRDRMPPRFEPLVFDVDDANERLQTAAVTTSADAGTPAFTDATEQLIADVTLLALVLGSWEEPDGRLTAWKTVRFEVLDVLQREGLIETTRSRKSLVITDRGARRAHLLRERVARLVAGRE